MNVSRVAGVPSLLEKMAPLVNGLIEKTNYHRRKYAKKFSKQIVGLGKGEFRLNVVDPAAPLFTKLSEAERRIRKEKRVFWIQTRMLSPPTGAIVETFGAAQSVLIGRPRCIEQLPIGL
jgi:hypothetical protein